MYTLIARSSLRRSENFYNPDERIRVGPAIRRPMGTVHVDSIAPKH